MSEIPEAIEAAIYALGETRGGWSHAVRDEENGSGTHEETRAARDAFLTAAAALRSLIAPLVQDAARLDWIEAQLDETDVRLLDEDFDGVVTIDMGGDALQYRGSSLRAAIDIAQEAA